jgi:hypothetical protein
MFILGAQPLLKVGPPAIEDLLPRGIESQEQHFLGGQLLGPHRGGLQPVEALEHLNRPPSGGRVRPTIHVPPSPGDVGPHRQLKALNQPVIPSAVEDVSQVALKRTRLDPESCGVTAACRTCA